MALTETQVEVSKDPTGLITRTTTKQAFAWEDPSNDARSYRVTQADGVVTVVEEFFDDMPAVYNVDVSTTQEPVESHPYWADWDGTERKLWSLWKQNPTNPELKKWTPATSENAQTATIYILFNKGITNYFAPRIVIKHVTLETSEPNLQAVGIISATGYGGDTGPVNFILTGLSAQQEGNKWRVTREYLGSARGSNWEVVLYT
jgi:hypothetical protein